MTEMRRGLKTQSVYGTLPGNTDENVIVLAHMDGWFDAALDNAFGHLGHVDAGRALREGAAAAIGAATSSLSARPVTTSARPTRSIFATSARICMSKTALMINCEHIAAAQTLNWNTSLREANGIDPRRWWVNGSRKMVDIVLNAYRTFGVNIVGDMDPGASGEMGAIARVAPSIQLIHSPEVKHTDHDVPEIVPAVGLEAAGRAYAKIIDEINKESLAALKPAAGSTR